ncbi:melanoma antigen preferentially expressed in tumors-like [Octodon degus]|uniref:Melanoma antigen preferentially expressed in tumors-like n=1 Tax=Octodon degus TaxID=10160 RepID=A0A6P3FPP2_OCTDE|nr:melanoma antigen preferentially expressed in tumors-like [Octodon degus]
MHSTPPPLYKLVKNSLLKSQTIASTALHDLPPHIYHDLFMDAFMGEHNEFLKVMVQAWPFPSLPLRALVDLRKSKDAHTQYGVILPQQRNLRTLKAILHGIDTKLSQKVQDSRWKLQVLDWRNVHQDFWTVTIYSSAAFDVLKILRSVELDSIHELDVLSDWSPNTMTAFAHKLKKMKNLHTFQFSTLSAGVSLSLSEKKWYSRIYANHLRQLHSLRELHLDKVHFLRGNLHKILGMISMKSFNFETIQVLLDKLANTLENLALEHCDITDSQILAILPALSNCSHLKTFSCYGNPLSLGILQVLLCRIAGLSHLNECLYPAPLESYEHNIPTESLHPQRFSQVCAALIEILKDIRPSLRIKIYTYFWDLCIIYRLQRLESNGNWEVTEEQRY